MHGAEMARDQPGMFGFVVLNIAIKANSEELKLRTARSAMAVTMLESIPQLIVIPTCTSASSITPHSFIG